MRSSAGRQAPGGLRSYLVGSRLRTTKNTGRSGNSSSSGPPCWLRWQRIHLQYRNPGSIPGSGRSPGEGSDSPLQCSCLENPMGRGAWRASVQGSQRVGLTDRWRKEKQWERTLGKLSLHWVMILSPKFHSSSKTNGNHLQYSNFV